MKKGSSMATSTIVLLIIAVLILVVLILGFTRGWGTLAPWLVEEEFKITKEECKNHSYIKLGGSMLEQEFLGTYEKEFALAGLEERSTNSVISYLESGKKTQTYTNIFDNLMNEIMDEYAYYNTPPERVLKMFVGRKYYEAMNISIEGKGIRLEKGNIKNLRYDMNTITIKYTMVKHTVVAVTKKVCEQVEVDEIKYSFVNLSKIKECGITQENNSGVLIITVTDDSEIDKITQNNITIYMKDCKDSEVYPIKTISKQDLTTEWLDKNCEEIVISQSRCRDKNKFPKPTCETYYSEYKCGNYTVEVIK